MADYGIQFLSKFFFYREDSTGAYITPARHVENSLNFGTTPSTVSEAIDKYNTFYGALEMTGIDTMLFWHFALQVMCTLSRIGGIFDGTYDLWTMQCYDNFVADIYLEQPEGLYTELDVFTWKGIATGYTFMIANNASYAVLSMAALNFVTYVYYLSGSMAYGDFYLNIPGYDLFMDQMVLTF